MVKFSLMLERVLSKVDMLLVVGSNLLSIMDMLFVLQMHYRWATDALQMRYRWATDRLQMGYRWATDGQLTATSRCVEEGVFFHGPAIFTS